MAVLTGISNAVRSGIAGAAGQAVKAGGNAVRNIAGLPVEGNNSNLTSSIDLNKRKNSSILTYPINVDSDPQQGHYIMFMINERISGNLAPNKTNKSVAEAMKKMSAERNYTPSLESPEKEEQFIAEQAILGARLKDVNTVSAGTKNRSLQMGKGAFNKNVATISLYMPAAVSVTYDVKYADKEIGTLAALGSSVIDSFKGSSGVSDTLTNITKSLTSSTAKEGLINVANKAIDTIAPGALALSQLESGSVVTPRMEIMFEGVGRRSFSYTFSFLPKSVQEARLVEDIIYHFKFYAMPSYTNETTRREMNIPGTFDISYMYKGNKNGFLNKISTCFLTNVQVEYGADRFTAYESTSTTGGDRGDGPPPQKSKITLQFTEIETLSQDHVKGGH